MKTSKLSTTASGEATRSGGRGAQIVREAGVWHALTVDWLNTMLAERAGLQRSYRALATLIQDEWEHRPFTCGPEEAPDFHYLIKRLLPRWTKAGLIQPKQPVASELQGSYSDPTGRY
ncbi:hypothetical protein [Phenylobacterium sp.]|uniref:hypothetical protein n=1 Tax=Phenylobacterium sp. TaxID=1871053 RepID=UPI0035AF83E0